MKQKNIALIIIFLTLIISIIIIISYDNNSNNAKWSNKEIIIQENNGKNYRQNLMIDGLDNIHIAWKGKKEYNNFNIYYKNKTEHNNWSKTQIINPEGQKESHCLAMKVDNNDTIHIAWLDETNYLYSGEDKDIFYRYKTLNKNWSDVELISKESNNDCNCPSISIKNENINIIWPDRNDDNNSDIDLYIRHKKIYDVKWSGLELITIDSVSDSLVCEIEEDNLGKKHVVWQEKNIDKNNENVYDIYYSIKEFNTDWNVKELISVDFDGNSISPSIEIDSENTVHVIWIDNTNIMNSGSDYDIFYRYKEYDKEWSKIELISKDSKENCNWPYLKIDSKDNIHIAWSDKTNYSNGNDYDIVYIRKDKNGFWTQLEIVTTDSNYDSNWPRFDVDSKGRVFMTWWDEVDTNWIIYFKIRKT